MTAFDGADTPASPAAQCRRRLQPGGAIMRRQRVNARLAHGRTDDHRIRLRCINSQQDKRVSAQRKLKYRHVVYGNDILQLQSVSENIGTALLTAKRNIPLRYFSLWKLGRLYNSNFCRWFLPPLLGFQPRRSYGETDRLHWRKSTFFYLWRKSTITMMEIAGRPFSIRPTPSPAKRTKSS